MMVRSKKTGIKQSLISDFENGSRGLNEDTAARLAEVLNLKIERLIEKPE